MRVTFAIFKKEMAGFLKSPQFYLVCFLCSTIFSWVYTIQLGAFADVTRNAMYMQGMPSQQFNIHYFMFMRHLSYLNLMLILVVPALTMRLFAEEKKLRTFDLLLTSPVTSTQIVIGKYLASLGAILVLTLMALAYPLVTNLFAEFNWAPLLIAFLGLFLVGAVYAASNLFCSSLTESAIVAYVMAVIFNLIVWFIGMGVEVADSPFMRQLFEHISLNSHLGALVEGTIRTNSLVFLGSLIFFFCFMSERMVESERWR